MQSTFKARNFTDRITSEFIESKFKNQEKNNSGREKVSNIIRSMKGYESEVFFDEFRIAGEVSLDFLIINNLPRKLPDLRRFKKLQKKVLLSVHEIINILAIDKGVILGKAKEFILNAEFTGKIRSKKEAIEPLKRNFQDSLI